MTTLALVLVATSLLASSSANEKPNILFYLADDLGFNDIGYHNDKIDTPRLDEAASQGVKLENYYVSFSCTPTRSQLLTGRYQIHTGLQHRYIYSTQEHALPADEVTIAEKMKEAGYQTHMIGKWHLGFYKSEFLPFNRGFDTFFGFLGAWVYYNQPKMFKYPNLEKVVYPDCWTERGPAYDNLTKSYSVDEYNKYGMDVIKNHDASKGPFFLYFSNQLPHSPLQVGNSYTQKYSWITDKNRRTIYGMVNKLDESFGKLVDTLKAQGLWNNTLIIFSTDNGGADSKGGNNYPLRGKKGTWFEGGVRAVSFVSGGYLTNNLANGIEPGHVNKELMQVSDWFPTLVTLGGGNLEGTKPLDGFNQWDTITKGSASPRTEILYNIDELDNPVGRTMYQGTFDTRIQAAIRVGDWKLLTGDHKNGDWHSPPEDNVADEKSTDRRNKNVWLFNIAEDPEERNDLSGQKYTKVKELLDRLAEYDAGRVPAIYPQPEKDPRSDPALHGGYWGPWLDDQKK